MTTFFTKTLGCRANAYDTHALENLLGSSGLSPADKLSEAGIIILNTCTVTSAADKDVAQFIKKARRENPGAKIIVTGCFVQAQPEVARGLVGADLILGNDRKDDLPTLIRELLAAPQPPLFLEPKAPRSILFAPAHSAHTRANLKIQDGCDASCAYCIVPRARGPARSVSLPLILAEVERLLSQGTREIVLTGIHIGMYGAGSQDKASERSSLASLLDSMFTQTSWATREARLRFSSLEPGEVTDELLEVISRHPGKVCDHFHLPLQSGSLSVLRRMNRPYTPQEFLARVAAIRAVFPEAALHADVIAGFPGESASEFQETIDLVNEARLSGLHVFPFSIRPHTAAATMPDQIPSHEILRRAALLRDLSETRHLAFARSFLGKTLRVLWERTVDTDGHRHGHADNFLEVLAPDTPSGPIRWNAMTPVTVTRAHDNGKVAATFSGISQ